MFQAINQTYQPPFRFFFPILFFVASLSAAPELEKKACSLSPDGTPDEFFLSRAFQEQRAGFHKTDERKTEEAKKHHETSVSFFEKFHTCRSEKNLGPTYLSAMSLATSFLELGQIDSALLWSDRAYQMYESPKVPPREIILLKTRVLLRKGDLENSGKLLESNLKNHPFDPDFLYYLGNIFYDLKQWNKSILYFISLSDSISKRDSGSKLRPTVLKFLGDLNYRLDYSRKSISHYDNYLKYTSSDTDVLFRIAQIYFSLGEFANAKKYLTQIRSINPRELDASHMLAEMYFIDSRAFAPEYFFMLEKEKKIPKDGIIKFISDYLKGNFSGLESDVSGYLLKNQNRLSAYVLYADLVSAKDVEKKYKAILDAGKYAFQYRQYMTAENYFLKALAIALDTKEFSKDVSLLYEKISQCKEAQKQYISSILNMRMAVKFATEPEAIDAFRFRLAYLLMNDSVKKYSEASSILGSLIQAHPENASYFYMQGILFIQKEDYKSAIVSFKKANELEPQDPNNLFYMAIGFDKEKDFPSAENSLNQAIALNPEASNSYNYLGYLYAEKGIQAERSEALLLKATDLEPDNSAYQDSLGWIYFKQDRISESLLHLHFAEQIGLDRDLEDPVIYDHLGDVYRTKQDLVKAELYFQKAILLSKDKEELKKLKVKVQNVQKELAK
jgi:tetratricopeptide (TPR) repeat protein